MATPHVYEEWHPHFDAGNYLERNYLKTQKKALAALALLHETPEDNVRNKALQETEPVDECDVPVRHMERWTIGEIDTLWNEFQIKRMMIQDIASQHQRTCASILYKLKSEGLLDWHGPLNCETIADIIDKANDLIRNADYEDDEEDEEDEDDEEDEKEEKRGKQCIVFETIADIIDKANDLIRNADYEDDEEDEDDEEYVPVLSEEEEEKEDEKEENRGKRHIVFENYKPDMLDYVLYAYMDSMHYAVRGARWTLNMFIEFLKFASQSNNL